MFQRLQHIRALSFILLSLYGAVALLPTGYMLGQNANGDISIIVCQSNPLSEFGHNGHDHNINDTEDFREKCGFGALTALAELEADADLSLPFPQPVKKSPFPTEDDLAPTSLFGLPLGARAPPVA